MNDTSSIVNREDYSHSESREGRTGSAATKVVAIIVSITLVLVMLFGFLFLRKNHEDKLSAAKRAEQVARPVPSPQAQVFQDEVRLKGSEAVVGGTVRNISAAPLEELIVEIELKGRSTQGVELKPIKLSPATLKPGEDGKYSLQISPSVWSGAQVVRLHSETQKSDIPFRPEMGEKRPPEKNPAAKVVVEQRPRRKGDDYINTPDTPIRIP